MSLFGIKEKKEIERLKSQMSPEQLELADLNATIEKQQALVQQLSAEAKNLEQHVSDLKQQVVETEENILMQSFGLYQPRYQFMKADEYKARLLEIRASQKDMIKDKTAVTGNTSWTVNGNASKGKKMVSDMQKLLLRAFNAECDDVIEHVKYNNIESSEKRITSSRDSISKLGQLMDIAITPRYYKLKIEELYLAFEYQQKKQQEKEEQKEARARMREEAKLAKEIEEARKKLEKEQTHYNNALAQINKQLEAAGEDERDAILEKNHLLGG